MGLSEPTRARIWDATRSAEERLPVAHAYIHELRAEVAALAAERAQLARVRQLVWWAGHAHEYEAAQARGEALAIVDRLLSTTPAPASAPEERCPETGELVEDCLCYMHADARTLAIRRGDIGPDEDWPAGSGER